MENSDSDQDILQVTSDREVKLLRMWTPNHKDLTHNLLVARNYTGQKLKTM
jgi:hypothetical protein